MNQQPSSHRVSFNGTRPLALTKRQAVSALGSSKLVARLLSASRNAGDGWLVIVRSGRDLLLDTDSVETAYQQLLGGEQPPLMPTNAGVRDLSEKPGAHVKVKCEAFILSSPLFRWHVGFPPIQAGAFQGW